ncbi:unnamed protein product [Boreogadus saida]
MDINLNLTVDLSLDISLDLSLDPSLTVQMETEWQERAAVPINSVTIQPSSDVVLPADQGVIEMAGQRNDTRAEAKGLHTQMGRSANTAQRQRHGPLCPHRGRQQVSTERAASYSDATVSHPVDLSLLCPTPVPWPPASMPLCSGDSM